MINNSLEWSDKESELLKKSKQLSNSKDIKSLIYNVRPKITELSNAEVIARRRRLEKTAYIESLLLEINNNIEEIEEYILVAALIG